MTDRSTQFFSSLVAEIKNYKGSDPLLPWLRGIRMMKQTLAPDLLKQKLPRFLQKCVLAFKDDRRYRNDARFVQVCVGLMDFVDDPGELLKMMETCKIGTKRTLFYQAYALHYEKRKRYVEAEKIYQLGVKILAVPMDELQKSYQQFLNRMHKRCKARMRDLNTSIATIEQGNSLSFDGHREPTDEVGSHTTDKVHLSKEADFISADGVKLPAVACNKENLVTDIDIPLQFNNEVGRRLIISTESFPCSIVPIEPLSEDARDHEKIVKENLYSVNGLHNSSAPSTSPLKGDGDLSCSSNIESRNDDNASGVIATLCASKEVEQITDNGSSLELQSDGDPEACQFSSFCGDDTIVVSKFVGCAIDGKSEAEHACHHGLVDPTVNTKEVMDDINSMFKKPLDVQVKNRAKAQKFQVEKVGKQEKVEIFVDECLHGADISSHDTDKDSLSSGPVTHGDETIMICRFTDAALVDDSDSPEGAYHHGLVEPTLFTKEAMNDINSMFGKPIEFKKPSATQKHVVHDTNKLLTEGTFEILVDDADSGSSGMCFVNGSACIESQSQLSCDPKIERLDAQKRQEKTKRENPSRSVLSILADDDDEENDCCDDKYKQFNCKSRLQCVSKSCSLMRTGDDDTSACRFMGTTVVGDHKADACKYGLVDSMINLKEAKSDTDSMFKRPPDFGEANGTERKGSDFSGKQKSIDGVTIPVDENVVGSTSHLPERSVLEFNLFEHTITTKEAIDDINNMFGIPLDY